MDPEPDDRPENAMEEGPDESERNAALMEAVEAGLTQVWTLVEDRLSLFAELVGRTAPGQLPEEGGKVAVDAEDYKVLHELARMVVQEAGLRALKKGKESGA